MNDHLAPVTVEPSIDSQIQTARKRAVLAILEAIPREVTHANDDTVALLANAYTHLADQR